VKVAWLQIIPVLSASLCAGQVTIVNPQQFPFPQEKVEVIFRLTCRAVAEEFQVKDLDSLRFPLTLFLGEANEHYSADEDKGKYTIYLKQWDESKFTTSVLRLAIWRMLPRKRRDRLVMQILERADRVAPVEGWELGGRLSNRR
jgi:hypothetical protein